MPKREWTPTTYGEWFDALIAYLEILRELVADRDARVKQSVVQSLAKIAADIVTQNERVFAAWVTVVKTIPEQDEAGRAIIARAIGQICDRWDRRLESEEDAQSETHDDADKEIARGRVDALRRLEVQLEGDDFGLQIRTALAAAMRREVYPGDASKSEDIQALAAQAVANPELAELQWSWLLADEEWSRAERWVEALGEQDSSRRLEGQLSRLAGTARRAENWLVLYDLAYARCHAASTWLTDEARRFVAEDKPLIALELLRGSPPADDRRYLLMSLFADSIVPAEAILQLSYSPWVNALEVAQIKALVGVTGREAPAETLAFVSIILRMRRSLAEALQPEAMDLLAASNVSAKKADRSYEWDSVAELFVDAAPMEIGAAVMERIGILETAHDGGLSHVLARAWQRSDKTAFFEKLVAPALLGDEGPQWWQRQMIGTLPLSQLDDDYMLGWVAVEPAVRARRLASVIGPPSPTPSPLQAAMLEQFGDQGVASAFYAEFMSGVFMGSEVNWLEGKLRQAERWAADERPAIREWGASLVRSLRLQVEGASQREAEEEFE
jgi:hypothetical protein